MLQTTYTQYDYFLGQPVNAEDANGIVSSIEYNDALNRPTKGVQAIGKPVARQTRFIYNDASSTVGGNPPHSITTISDKDGFEESTNGNGLKVLALYDGLGRTRRSATYEGNTWAITDTQFDALGRVWRTSNPFRDTDPATTTSSAAWTTTSYDALSRITIVQMPDTAVVTTSYSGNAVTVTDQAGKQRRSLTDALGRLLRVDEPNGCNTCLGTLAAPVQPTSYGYDALDNLTSVAQGVQTRTFVYDSLSRLTSATNPESGLTSYQYDSNGNLLIKTDARGVIAYYSYDALNRPTTRSYNPNTTPATPAVNYYYDNQTLPGVPPTNFNRGSAKGRLVAVTYDGVGSGNYYGYDELGRTRQSFQRTASQDYSLSYGYNRAGLMIVETYPSGRVVTTRYDAAGRLNDVKLAGRNWSYASQFSYAAHGAVKEMKLGNGLWEQMMFNSRLRVTQIGLGTMSGDTSKLRLDYDYGTTTNNGNVLSQTINIAATSTHPSLTRTQNYTYDALNRLQTATEVNSWRQTYDYDRYGNRIVINNTADPLNYVPEDLLTPQGLGDYEAGTNRLNSGGWWAHDAAGNQTKAGEGAVMKTFAYDAENRLVRSWPSNVNYSYDGEGRRVQKVQGSATTVYVYNAQGQLIAEYTNTAPAVATGGTKYVTADTLGSTRLVTSGGRGDVKARYDYLPFGQEIGAERGGRAGVIGYNAGETLRQRFTGYERDSETELDFAQARHYTSKAGRFMSPDLPFADQDVIDPQSWNLYGYVRNNPLRHTDPSGRGISDFFQKLKNFFLYGSYDTNVTILVEEDYRRQWLRDNFYVRNNQGNWQRFDDGTYNRSEIFYIYDNVQRQIAGNDVYQLTPEEMASALPVPGRPALGKDPYHPDEVAKRAKDLEQLKGKMLSVERAAERLGFNRVVKDPPFNSHGQKVFTDGTRYITRDIDSHSGGVWKMFNRAGERLGTYNANLERIGN